ncbi:nucleoside triphosphate pyrophosphohydrolase [Eilatimonas milleporae]|uniref:Nucleoside triphosphate pyrophosphohydrolase n=1 Tax=Eilatimonas milleporae TaxID=911205 RepID=A0A3M0CGM5_9PROT|nr:nucleoside triphosphate pyrophosphohydrolase [Eilatimonas milleporae]RMB08764.1 ATP diphosphatase [Eilatimonas milleporae]
MDDPLSRRYAIGDLIDIMARLRDPRTGCPWDVEQSFETIAPYTIEEAYEVDQAIRDGDMAELAAELGDLLLQVIFHSRMAEEAGHFTFADVVHGISDKMVRRHPHVFAGATVEDADAQTHAWETQKARERHAKAAAEGRVPSALDGVIPALPALLRALKLQKRAARVGFDWPSSDGVIDKIAEEAEELRQAKDDGSDPDHIAEEMGDLLFAAANLARHLSLDPEETLRAANAKFERRFRRIEAFLAESGRTPEQSDLGEMDTLWNRAKAEEKAGTAD